MEIIPVIDICRGRAVHALKGERASYQPVQSGLCAGSDPYVIVQAFLDIHPFKTIYVADLDAISGGQTLNYEIINSFNTRFPDTCFWIDEGNANREEILAVHKQHRIQVTGSESGISSRVLDELKNITPQPVLSLDFRQGDFIGYPDLLLNPQNWPDKVIIMSLARVGSEEGPNLGLLNEIISMARNKKFYLAGGIRDKGDLMSVNDTGIAGVLMATALHNREISALDIREITGL